MEYTSTVFLFLYVLKTTFTNFWFYMRVRFEFIKKSHFFSSWIWIFKKAFTFWAPQQICFHNTDYDQIAAKRVGKKILIKLLGFSTLF